MDYLVRLNGKQRIGTCPDSIELKVLIRAALAAVPEYQVFDVEVQKARWLDSGGFAPELKNVPVEDEFGHGYD